MGPGIARFVLHRVLARMRLRAHCTTAARQSLCCRGTSPYDITRTHRSDSWLVQLPEVREHLATSVHRAIDPGRRRRLHRRLPRQHRPGWRTGSIARSRPGFGLRATERRHREPDPWRWRRAPDPAVAGANPAQPAQRQRRQGLPGLRAGAGTADALPHRCHPGSEPGQGSAVVRERPAGRGSHQRHLQPARRRDLERRHPVHRQRCALHLGMADRRRRQVRQQLGQQVQVAETISDVEVVDDLTVTVHFTNPNPLWFENHAGTSTGFIYPKHVLERTTRPRSTPSCSTRSALARTWSNRSPSNDQVIYAVNENYREPNKPFFSRGRRSRVVAMPPRPRGP